MSLTYGWDATVPHPASSECPASAAAKWQDDFCYIEGTLAVVAPSAGSELITNGAFTPAVSGWTASGASAYHSSGGQAGSCAAVSATVADGGIYQDVVVSAATVYRATFYYKASGVSDLPQLGIYDLSNGAWITPTKSLSNTTSWSSQQKITFTTPTGCASVRFWYTAGAADDLIYLDTVSMKANTGGFHTFPGTYGSTAGQHSLGRAALMYTGTTAEVSALSNVQYGFSFDETLLQFKFNTGDAASAVNDLITNDQAVTIGANITFETSGGSVDGRKYSTDGTKLDTCSEYSRHVIIADGTVAHGSSIPWPTENLGTKINSGGELITNGAFTSAVSSWTASGASAYHSAGGKAGSCAAISATSNHGGIYQDVTVTAGSLYRLLFYYKGAATTDDAQYALYDVTNGAWITSYTTLASTTTWSASQSVTFTAPTDCTTARVIFAASTSGELVYVDTVSLYKRVFPTITPASCETMEWFIGIYSLGVSGSLGTYGYNWHKCYLQDDGSGYYRKVYCYAEGYLIADATGTANYILVGVRSI